MVQELLQVWEKSVRATHLFLSDEEVKAIKNYVPQALSGIAHLLIDKDVKKSGSTMPETFAYLIKYIEHNFSSDLTLDFLAEFSSMSKYHLCREFKKYTGMTPIQFLIYTRIENAKFLLKHTDLPIGRIAAQTGFMDLNNFNNQFKKHTGCTASHFRKSGTL